MICLQAADRLIHKIKAILPEARVRHEGFDLVEGLAMGREVRTFDLQGHIHRDEAKFQSLDVREEFARQHRRRFDIPRAS